MNCLQNPPDFQVNCSFYQLCPKFCTHLFMWYFSRYKVNYSIFARFGAKNWLEGNNFNACFVIQVTQPDLDEDEQKRKGEEEAQLKKAVEEVTISLAMIGLLYRKTYTWEKCLSLSLKKKRRLCFNEVPMMFYRHRWHFIKWGIVIDIFITYLFKIAAKAKNYFSTIEWEYSKKII